MHFLFRTQRFTGGLHDITLIYGSNQTQICSQLPRTWMFSTQADHSNGRGSITVMQVSEGTSGSHAGDCGSPSLRKKRKRGWRQSQIGYPGWGPGWVGSCGTLHRLLLGTLIAFQGTAPSSWTPSPSLQIPLFPDPSSPSSSWEPSYIPRALFFVPGATLPSRSALKFPGSYPPNLHHPSGRPLSFWTPISSPNSLHIPLGTTCPPGAPPSPGRPSS